MYGSASQTIRDLLIPSDHKMVNVESLEGGQKGKAEAPCLHAAVSAVIRKVNAHITLLDPKNVADRLKAVAYSIEAKKALAVQKQTSADNAADMLTEAQKANEAAAKGAKDAAEDANKAQVENTVQSLAAEAHDCSDLNVLPSACGLIGTHPAS